MDNNSGFVPYGTDPFDSPLLQNFIEMDPALVYLSNDGPSALPQQQNDPVGVQQSNVSFTEPTIQNQSMRTNNNFSIGGEFGNFEAGPSRRNSKEPIIQDQFMHGNNDFFNGGGIGNFGPGPWTQGNQSEQTYENMGPQNYQEVISLPFWPPLPRPFFCSCCQVLRQIIHTNGSTFEKLEIHGRIGLISHAIIQIQSITPVGPSSDSHQMIDFYYRNAEQIKSFLERYCEQQNELGYVIVEDPLSAYYEALCAGLDWAEDLSDEDDDFIPPNDMEPESEPEPENGTASTSRPNRGIQIERVARMTLSDLSGVFHIPIKAAAKQLDICPSAVKKICRRADLKRWPQRKVKSLMKRVAVLKSGLDSPDPGTRARTRAEIGRLQQEIIEWLTCATDWLYKRPRCFLPVAIIYAFNGGSFNDATIAEGPSEALMWEDMATSDQTRVCVKQVRQEVADEWDESMPLPGDIIEGFSEHGADDSFLPVKASSELSSQLGKINPLWNSYG
ncbi:NLP6 protein [Spatholobus suberectus]|nr:NLP6 protein [Spatholobus suberectus]